MEDTTEAAIKILTEVLVEPTSETELIQTELVRTELVVQVKIWQLKELKVLFMAIHY